jgi:hypothetical protein
MSESEDEEDDEKEIPFPLHSLPRGYREDIAEYPSDRLTLGQLRAIWPNPDEMAHMLRDARVMESNFASRPFWDESLKKVAAEMGDDKPLTSAEVFKAETEEDIRDLKTFYIKTGLAAGDHAAELLVRGLEEQGRNQLPPRPR